MAAFAFTVAAQDSVAGGKPVSTASFQVRNKKFGDLLRPEDANSANGTRIVLYPAQMWKCMTWKMIPAGESAFALQNHFTSKSFAVDPKSATHAVVQVPFAKEAGERVIWRTVKIAEGTCKIVDAKSGDALTAVKGNDGTVTIVTAAWQDKDEQRWELVNSDPKQLTM